MIDIDSFVGEVCGDQKQGAGYGYTKQLGYHPLAATRSGTREVLHIRNRKGKANTQRGNPRFVDELLAWVRRAGATGTILIRADSGFENHKLFKTLDARGVKFSSGVKQRKPIRALIEQILDADWITLTDYPEGGEAQIAETELGDWRLIVRRTRLTGAQAELFPDCPYHAFASNRTEPLQLVEAEHREHAVVELAMRDLKDQPWPRRLLPTRQGSRNLLGPRRRCLGDVAVFADIARLVHPFGGAQPARLTRGGVGSRSPQCAGDERHVYAWPSQFGAQKPPLAHGGELGRLPVAILAARHASAGCWLWAWDDHDRPGRQGGAREGGRN